jgi:predicted transcriptional regulator
MAEWMFLTNHAHVLLCIAEDPNSRLRDLASRVQISERAVKRIVADLERTGYISRHRFGRRNQYELHEDTPIHSPMTKTLPAGDLLKLLVPMLAGQPLVAV